MDQITTLVRNVKGVAYKSAETWLNFAALLSFFSLFLLMFFGFIIHILDFYQPHSQQVTQQMAEKVATIL